MTSNIGPGPHEVANFRARSTERLFVLKALMHISPSVDLTQRWQSARRAQEPQRAEGSRCSHCTRQPASCRIVLEEGTEFRRGGGLGLGFGTMEARVGIVCSRLCNDFFGHGLIASLHAAFQVFQMPAGTTCRLGLVDAPCIGQAR